jgi:hypothetical protein
VARIAGNTKNMDFGFEKSKNKKNALGGRTINFTSLADLCQLRYQKIMGKSFSPNHGRQSLKIRPFFTEMKEKELDNFMLFDPIKNETRKFDRSQGQPGIIECKDIKYSSLIKIIISGAIH